MRHTTLLFTLLLAVLPTLLFSARFRSAEIQVEQIGPLTVAASIIVYTPASVAMTDSFRETLQLQWGDGTFSVVSIVNGTDENGDGVLDGELIEPGFRKFVYTGEHVYALPGRYLTSVENPNRLAGMLNINFPNSVSIPLSTETEIEVFAAATNNRTPVLLEPGGVDIAEMDDTFLHLPNAYDQDDDSLVYELVVPIMGPGEPVPNYFGIDNEFGVSATVEAETGIFDFAAPEEGFFGFAIQITSYRNGIVQDRMIRDITLFNEQPTTNVGPSISLDTPQEIIQEVSVGDTVRFQCQVTDEPDQNIRLTATSGLLSFFTNPATFTIEGNTGSFEWVVRDEHARTQPYPVVIKAEDDANEFGASSFALVRYRVNGGLVNTAEPEVGSWLVYPNPVRNKLLLQAPTSELDLPLRYQIFAANGQVVQYANLNSLPGQISVATLPPGTYYLQLEKDGQRWTEQFVKQ